jgi:chromosome segregation ATPase
MKKSLSIFTLVLFSFVGFSQSKKELREQVTTLTSEKQKLIDEKQKLMDDILNLKQQIVDLKTDNLNYKSENEQLRTTISANNNVSSNTSNADISKQNTNTSQTSSGRCQAITANGTQCTRHAEPGLNIAGNIRKYMNRGVQQRLQALINQLYLTIPLPNLRPQVGKP